MIRPSSWLFEEVAPRRCDYDILVRTTSSTSPGEVVASNKDAACSSGFLLPIRSFEAVQPFPAPRDVTSISCQKQLSWCHRSSDSDSGGVGGDAQKPYPRTSTPMLGIHHAHRFVSTPERHEGIVARDDICRSTVLVDHNYHDHAFQWYAFVKPCQDKDPSIIPEVVPTRNEQEASADFYPDIISQRHSSIGLATDVRQRYLSQQHQQQQGSTTEAIFLAAFDGLTPEDRGRHRQPIVPPLLTGRILFPEKLYQMLRTTSHDATLKHVASWQPHGRCFIIHRSSDFVDDVLPKYFQGQQKLTSFQRQLNLYGFKRITQGRDRGAYYHEFFLRGRPLLCKRITRIQVKGTRVKPTPNPEMEPNFYKMPPCLEEEQLWWEFSTKNTSNHLAPATQFTLMPSTKTSSPATLLTTSRSIHESSLSSFLPRPLAGTVVARFSPSNEIGFSNSNFPTSDAAILQRNEKHQTTTIFSADNNNKVNATYYHYDMEDEADVATTFAATTTSAARRFVAEQDDEDPLLDSCIAEVDPTILEAYEKSYSSRPPS